MVIAGANYSLTNGNFTRNYSIVHADAKVLAGWDLIIKGLGNEQDRGLGSPMNYLVALCLRDDAAQPMT